MIFSFLNIVPVSWLCTMQIQLRYEQNILLVFFLRKPILNTDLYNSHTSLYWKFVLTYLYLTCSTYIENYWRVLSFIQCGRTTEAEIQFEKLLGPLHVKSAMAELSRSERGDDGENVKYSELFYGRNFNGTSCYVFHSVVYLR